VPLGRGIREGDELLKSDIWM